MGVDARGVSGGLLRLDPAFAYVEPPSSWPLSRAEYLTLAPNKDSTYGHHQMVNTKIRLIIFFAAKDGEALYSQQKQDLELTVAQIMNSLLPNSDLNWTK